MGMLLCEQKCRDVWSRNESVGAEIGQILHTHSLTHTHTHTHTTAAKLVVRMTDVLTVSLFPNSYRGALLPGRSVPLWQRSLYPGRGRVWREQRLSRHFRRVQLHDSLPRRPLLSRQHVPVRQQCRSKYTVWQQCRSKYTVWQQCRSKYTVWQQCRSTVHSVTAM